MKIMRKEDRIINDLKGLFDQNGYHYYKMRKFEEYSLYMENKNFLSNEYIITFNHNGKLLALKPDVTLSIVKNAKACVDKTEKLYYREGVFRYDRKSHEYKEVNQIGLEVMGDIDVTTDCEILSLAMKSLELISDKYVLCISNTGIIGGILEHLKITSYETKNLIIKAIKEKSKHTLEAILNEVSVSLEGKQMLYDLFEGKIPQIEEVSASADNLNKTLECMSALGYKDKIKIDFSIINDVDGLVIGVQSVVPKNTMLLYGSGWCFGKKEEDKKLRLSILPVLNLHLNKQYQLIQMQHSQNQIEDIQ
jgi:ATP phosphoribosyltransferase regulatory subunit